MSALDYCETITLPKRGYKAAVTLWRDSCLPKCSTYYAGSGTITSHRPVWLLFHGEQILWGILARLAVGEHLSPHDVDAAADGVDAENALAIRAACESVAAC